LNRARSAHALSALAVRLSLTLGLHRNDVHDKRLSPVETERRHRVWWSVYNVDRLGCLKLGQPALIRDEDIDAPLPSMDGLTDMEKAEFVQPEGLIAKTNLSKITGSILDMIYRTPRAQQKDRFVQNVHQILARLKSWNENLPTHLKLNRSASPPYASRSVASLHLQFDDVRLDISNNLGHRRF
jgi:proline utilization trans-activator